MKKLLLTTLLMTSSVNVFAACSGTLVSDANATLSGKTLCVGSSGAWENQEYHQAGGALIDYKMGAGHSVDPTTQIGTWSASGASVTYSYTDGGSFIYSVYDLTGGNYCLQGATDVTATAKNGQVAC
jgi:hypothetical protein